MLVSVAIPSSGMAGGFVQYLAEIIKARFYRIHTSVVDIALLSTHVSSHGGSGASQMFPSLHFAVMPVLLKSLTNFMPLKHMNGKSVSKSIGLPSHPSGTMLSLGGVYIGARQCVPGK